MENGNSPDPNAIETIPPHLIFVVWIGVIWNAIAVYLGIEGMYGASNFTAKAITIVTTMIVALVLLSRHHFWANMKGVLGGLCMAFWCVIFLCDLVLAFRGNLEWIIPKLGLSAVAQEPFWTMVRKNPFSDTNFAVCLLTIILGIAATYEPPWPKGGDRGRLFGGDEKAV